MILGKHGNPSNAGAFVERTIVGAAAFLKESVVNDEIAGRSGFLQRRDPRLKCLSVALLLACALLTRSVVVLAALYVASLVLAFVSRIGPGFFLKRTALFIPLFALVIAMPAIFGIVTPGEPLVGFGLLGMQVSITGQGIDAATLLFMRVLASVSLSVLLVLTTRHHVLLKVLRAFRVPQLFVMTLGMSYRYIYLFLDIVQNTFVAIRSRVGFVASTGAGRRIVAANAASLWLRSYRMHSDVYSAMLSRGFCGEPHVLEKFRARTTDYLIVAAALATLVGTLWLNRYSH